MVIISCDEGYTCGEEDDMSIGHALHVLILLISC